MSRPKPEEWLTEEKLIILEGWARDGLTDEQIAEKIGISARTLYRWEKKHSQICQALKKGKDLADRKVENALYKRALGYDYIETRTKIKDGAEVEKTTITKHVPGDTTAQIFWLKNRNPGAWRNGSGLSPVDEEQIHFYFPDNGRDKTDDDKE